MTAPPSLPDRRSSYGRHRLALNVGRPPLRRLHRALQRGGLLLVLGLGVSVLPAGAQQRPAVPAVPFAAVVDPVELKAVEFTGGGAVAASELDAVVRPFIGRPVRQDDLEELRQRLSRLYAEKGYLSSGALLSRLDAARGVLVVHLLEGRVSALEVQGQGRLSADYFRQRLTRPDEAFNVNVLQERFRTLSADPLLSRLDVRVFPGDALGETVLAVEVRRAPPLEVTLFGHNHQAPSVGAAAGGAEIVVRNLSTWGDTLGLTVSRNRGGANADAAWTVPLRAGRTLLGLRVARSHASVVEEPLAQLDVDSVVRTHEVSVLQPLVDDTRTRWVLGLTGSVKRNATTLGGEPFSFVAGNNSSVTQARSARLLQEWSQREGSRVLALRTVLTLGTNNLPSPVLLEEQPRRRYAALLLQGQGVWALDDRGTQLALRTSAQLAPQRLVPTEQFAVGGRHSVRGYRENQLVRDRGWSTSLELRRSWAWGEGTPHRATLVAFADAGSAANVGEASTQLASLGLGGQWQAKGADVELYWGRALKTLPKPPERDLQDRGVHLSLRWKID
jgi:hemolysin activation/secretion protein